MNSPTIKYFPNFLIIGAQKAGTTSIYYYLNQHPQIFMSPIKEPGFFDFENEKLDFKGPRDKDCYAQVITDLDDYCKLFQNAQDKIVLGEATTWYLYSPKAAERIQYYIPNAKLIAILRNPVDRAYSAFMHAIRDGREPIKNFSKALQQEEKRIQQNWEYIWRYKSMGLYHVQLRRYFDRFDKSQIKVYLYEDLEASPEDLIQDIFEFLGVDENFTPSILKKYNISGSPRSQFFHHFLNTSYSIKEPLKKIIPSDSRERIRASLEKLNLKKSPIPHVTRVQLVRQYSDDILKLQDLIDRDLSAWLE